MGWRQGDFTDNSIKINNFFLWKKITFLDILQARGIKMTSPCLTTMTLISSISSGNSKMACMSNFGWGKCRSDVQNLCLIMKVSKDSQKDNECFLLGGINDRSHIDYYWLVHVRHINALAMYIVQYIFHMSNLVLN